MKTAILCFLVLTACAGGVMLNAACDVYQTHRLSMPDPLGASRQFLEWINLLDVNMLAVCKRG